MNTDARRKASAAFHAKRTADGYRKVTLWLSEEARDLLRAWADDAGSKDKAAELAIMAYRGASPLPDSAKVARDVGRVTNEARPARPTVPTLQRKAFNPQPKSGKAKR